MTTQKTKTSFDGPFWKNTTWPSKGSKKVDLFHCFSRFLPKWIIIQGQFFLYFTQWIKALHISIQTPYGHYKFWKKWEKNYRKGVQLLRPLIWLSLVFFSPKMVNRNEFWFLHFNQCLKTLHLSYQTALLGIRGEKSTTPRGIRKDM